MRRNGLSITYGPIGSGGGINAITNRTVVRRVRCAADAG